MPNVETVRMPTRIVRNPSQYISGEKTIDFVYMCPRCNVDMPNAGHRKLAVCQHCGLHVTVIGSLAEIYEVSK